MMIFMNSSSKKKKTKLTKAKQKVLDDYNVWRKQNKLPAVSSLNAEKISSSFQEYKPKVSHARSTSHIKSLESTAPAVCARNSIMDRTSLDKEPEHVREQIIAKSKRIALMYNKGAYQYISDEIDITTIGTRNRRM
jgi:hypothetical protein